MNISSINSNWWYKVNTTYSNSVNTSTTADTAQTTSNQSSIKATSSNVDGDTFQFSGATPPPPPPGPPPGSNNNASSGGDDPLKSFLDKVASGTATESDMTNIQSFLQQMKQQMSASSSDDSSNSSSSSNSRNNDPLKVFLDKVAGGTATSSDLTDIQSFLQQLNQNFRNS